MLTLFNKCNDIVNRLDNNKDSLIPIQSWNSLHILMFGLVGLIKINVIEQKTQSYLELQILME